MAKIHIQNLKVNALIGTKDSEQETKQEINIIITLEYDSKEAIAGDDISKAVDYEQIATAIGNYVESSHFQLLETLCSSILNIVMADPFVEQATVSLNKPKAIPNADSTIVELSAKKV